MMSTKKKVTIYDIAEKINYSPSTVSRALNNHKSIGAKTIKKIKEVASEMGYRPNTLAVSLRSNRSNTLGILISRINRPFISSLISGIEEKAREGGYHTIISQSNDKYENEVANAKVLFDNQVSGMVVSLAMETTNFDHFNQFLNLGIPLVFVDRVPKLLNTYKVVIDNFQSGYMATKHLIEQGCRNIAHFAGAQHQNVYADRKAGYLFALQEYNLPIREELICNFDTLSFEEGKKFTEMLLNLNIAPDGIFSANDTAAVSAIITAKEKGINIPEKLAIIGFNNDPIASIVDPGYQLSLIQLSKWVKLPLNVF